MGGDVAVGKKSLQIWVLGEIAVLRGGRPLDLPPSKKTRALLAYLVLTGRPHRRERLCSMFWDVADDPRGALRWSLSKLRTILDDSGDKRIVADREMVSFTANTVEVDWVSALSAQRAKDPLSKEALAKLARAFRGELCEGLDLPDFDDYQAWLVGERERARRAHAEVLSALVSALADAPAQAVEHAERHVQIEPLDERARATLVRLLGQLDRRAEAEQHVKAAQRLARELGARRGGEVEAAWSEVQRRSAGPPPPSRSKREEATPEPPPPASIGPTSIARVHADAPQLVGRGAELDTLQRALDDAHHRRRLGVVLLAGEPGVGKTRLLGELRARATTLGGAVLAGSSFEAERNRPYGPWFDALRAMSREELAPELRAALAALLPELGEAGSELNREQLFAAVVELISAQAGRAAPLVLLMDDVQWADEASVALLHYVCRSTQRLPMLIAMATRAGEVTDNEPLAGLLRGLRRERALREVDLVPLGPDDTAELSRHLGTTLDPETLYRQCGGNPLYAVELARAGANVEVEAAAAPTPRSLADLVRDRVDRLPAEAADVLRWGAVLGHGFSVDRLRGLTSLDLAALEVLERHALLRASDHGDAPGRYDFAHEIVRQVVYSDVSEPRRRLMHLRIAESLEGAGEPDEAIASEIAHHAAMAGDSALAARACASAGRYCVRVFAHRQAAALARRGLRYAAELPERDRVRLAIELQDILNRAHQPEDVERTATEIAELAERAEALGLGEHARRGFNLVSHLRFDAGDPAGAKRDMLRAERASRGGDEHAQAEGLAEAAKCLVLLERDLAEAERLMTHAGRTADRSGSEPPALPIAQGMLKLHQGHIEDAYECLDRALRVGSSRHDMTTQVLALEHLVKLEWTRGDIAAARGRARELEELAAKLREGSEAPFARAVVALLDQALASDTAPSPSLDAALRELRDVDAKNRLAWVLARAAEVDVRRGDLDHAVERASEALELARLLDRPSDVTLCHVALARAASARRDPATLARHLAELRRETLSGISWFAEQEVERFLAELPSPNEEG